MLTDRVGKIEDDLDILERSPIREGLKEMLGLLFKEDKNRQLPARGTAAESALLASPTSRKLLEDGIPLPGPCYEYLLEHHVIETLCSMGFANRPPGMQVLVLQTVRSILKRVTHPLLPHGSVHGPIRQLVRVCTAVIADKSERSVGRQQTPIQEALLNLIETLWLRVHEDPSQIIFFHERAGVGRGPLVPIVDAVVDYFSPASGLSKRLSQVTETAHRALLLLVSIPHPLLDDYLITETLICEMVVEELCSAMEKLLETKAPADISRRESVSKTAFPAAIEMDRLENVAYQNALTVFVAKLLYCDEVASASFTGHPTQEEDKFIGPRLLMLFRAKVLERVLSRRLLGIAMEDVLNATSCVLVMINELVDQSARQSVPVQTTNSDRWSVEPTSGVREGGYLLSSLLDYLLGESIESETSAIDSTVMISLLSPGGASRRASLAAHCSLLQRIGSKDPSLSMATMELISTLLDIDDPRVLHILLIRNLVEGNHLLPQDQVPGVSYAPKEAVHFADAGGVGSPLDVESDIEEEREAAIMSISETVSESRDRPILDPPAFIPSSPSRVYPSSLTLASTEPHGSSGGHSGARSSSSARRIAHCTMEIERFMSAFPNSPMPGRDATTAIDASFDSYLRDAQASALCTMASVERYRTLAIDSSRRKGTPGPLNVPAVVEVIVNVKGEEESTEAALGPGSAPSETKASPSRAPLTPLKTGLDDEISTPSEVTDDRDPDCDVIVKSLFASPSPRKKQPNFSMRATPAVSDSLDSLVEVPLPLSAMSSPAVSADVSPVFYEGMFLEMLFNRLEHLFQSTLEENLQVTELLSKLANFPIPIVHDYLFETEQVKPGTRTLKAVLKTVWREAQERRLTISNAEDRLSAMRVSMGVDSIAADSARRGSGVDAAELDATQLLLLQNYILLEEFLKELGCIAQAKKMVSALNADAHLPVWPATAME